MTRTTIITNKRGRNILAGIGLTLIMTAAGAATLIGGSMQTQAIQSAAHPTPSPSVPTATITKTLPQATITMPPKVITKQLPQATKTITLPAPTYLQCPGKSEDSCYPDYIGKGRWVIRQGERPIPKATEKVAPSKKVTSTPKKVRKATIVPGVCKHPSIITRAMLQNCISLAGRAKVVAPGKYEIPAGEVLVRECTEQYTGRELDSCLKQ